LFPIYKRDIFYKFQEIQASGGDVHGTSHN
jgi:hypothetical protein